MDNWGLEIFITARFVDVLLNHTLQYLVRAAMFKSKATRLSGNVWKDRNTSIDFIPHRIMKMAWCSGRRSSR